MIIGSGLVGKEVRCTTSLREDEVCYIAQADWNVGLTVMSYGGDKVFCINKLKHHTTKFDCDWNTIWQAIVNSIHTGHMHNIRMIANLPVKDNIYLGNPEQVSCAFGG